MRKFKLKLIATFITTTLISPVTFAAAFQFYELGTPIIATAGVGQAAVAEDASTTYFNPAGMALLNHTEVMLGSQMLLPFINFSKNTSTTISGDNGGNAGSLVPGLGIYYLYSYNPCLKFGISLTAPYGGSLDYNDGWAGRFDVQNALFYTLNLNPAVSYKINSWLALGAGGSVEYMNLQQTTALRVLPPIDGQLNVKVDNFSGGYNFGVMLTPFDSTKVGVAYRSEIVHTLRGKLSFLRIGFTPAANTKMVMPQNVILSLAQALTARFTLLGEAGWSNWSAMKNTTLNVIGVSVDTPENWHDTYRLGLGGQYLITPALTFQLGASFDSSPTNSSHRLPVLPMDRQVRVGTGVTYAIIHNVSLGLSYEYMNFGKATIHSDTSAGVLSGSYSRNYGNTFQFSLNVMT